MDKKNGKGNGKDEPTGTSGIELFGHIKTAQNLASHPSDHFESTAQMGWLANLSDQKAGGDKNFFQDEVLQSLSIINPRLYDALRVEMVVGRACNDYVSSALVEATLRLSPSVKGQGRKDLKEIMGGVKQNISMPTALQKTRRILTGRGGKEIETEQTDSVEVGE